MRVRQITSRPGQNVKGRSRHGGDSDCAFLRSWAEHNSLPVCGATKPEFGQNRWRLTHQSCGLADCRRRSSSWLLLCFLLQTPILSWFYHNWFYCFIARDITKIVLPCSIPSVTEKWPRTRAVHSRRQWMRWLFCVTWLLFRRRPLVTRTGRPEVGVACPAARLKYRCSFLQSVAGSRTSA